MKIIIFIENNQKGGLDTFSSTLINHWPNQTDSFTVISNISHPGNEGLRKSIIRPCEFVSHNIPLSWIISKKIFFFLPHSIRKISQPFLRMILFPFQAFFIFNIFKKYGGEELLVVNGAFPGGESCRIANIVWSLIGRKPGIHNFHNFTVSPRFGFGWYEHWIDRLLLRSTKLFISVSRSCSESLKERTTFQEACNTRYIYNGIGDVPKQNSALNIREMLGLKSDPLCIMLGNYEPRKGHKFIFEVFDQVIKIIPNAHLIVCGAGLRQQVTEVNGLNDQGSFGSNIHLLGFFPDGAELINQADVLLIGSQAFESFGLTALEAMIREKPVVSTDVGGLPEVLGLDDTCGYLVDRRDVSGFAMKIVLLLENEQLRTTLGKAGRVRALDLFGADRMAQEYLIAIEE